MIVKNNIFNYRFLSPHITNWILTPSLNHSLLFRTFSLTPSFHNISTTERDHRLNIIHSFITNLDLNIILLINQLTNENVRMAYLLNHFWILRAFHQNPHWNQKQQLSNKHKRRQIQFLYTSRPDIIEPLNLELSPQLVFLNNTWWQREMFTEVRVRIQPCAAVLWAHLSSWEFFERLRFTSRGAARGFLGLSEFLPYSSSTREGKRGYTLTV